MARRTFQLKSIEIDDAILKYFLERVFDMSADVVFDSLDAAIFLFWLLSRGSIDELKRVIYRERTRYNVPSSYIE
jgi:hypothetical protein